MACSHPNIEVYKRRKGIITGYCPDCRQLIKIRESSISAASNANENSPSLIPIDQDNYAIYQGDCQKILKSFPEASIDAVITDPPYELGFMSKGWDKQGIAFNVSLWKEIFRVVKPGGHIAVFGGSRTFHRTTCAIEDADFEIRDVLMWLYGQGFPKSLDISKAIDKMKGCVKVVGKGKAGKTALGQSSGWNKTNNPFEYDIVEPNSPEAQKWYGWGTALKPAYEPIILARKPISEASVALNVLTWGTGGLNIDASRIKYKSEKDAQSATPQGRCTARPGRLAGKAQGGGERNEFRRPPQKGRYPANVILDEHSARLLDAQTGILHGDERGASRFFYTSKAPQNERYFLCKKCDKVFPIKEQDSHGHRGHLVIHPTVKPLKLMEYLVRLIVPPEGIVLDPFAGTGTTLVAAKDLGLKAIGIELSDDYCKIARWRLSS